MSDGVHIRAGLPLIRAQGRTVMFIVGNTVRSQGRFRVQLDGFQLADGGKLAVQLTAQVFGLLRVQFKRGQLHK